MHGNQWLAQIRSLLGRDEMLLWTIWRTLMQSQTRKLHSSGLDVKHVENFSSDVNIVIYAGFLETGFYGKFFEDETMFKAELLWY